MPIYFSTIEDAWGNVNNYPLEKKNKSKSKNVNKTKEPLCELYGKRYSKVSKPFSSNDDFDNNFAEYDKNPYNKNMINKNTKQNRQEYYPIELDEYSSFASVKAIENADDEDYLLNALNKTETNQKENLVLNRNLDNLEHNKEDSEDESDDDSDNGENYNNQKKNSNAKVIKNKPISEHKEKINDSINDENYLELGLFATSGILLIFMMEKIFQLGLLMKN